MTTNDTSPATIPKQQISNPQCQIKDPSDILCHPISHGSHSPLITLQFAVNVNKNFQSWSNRFVRIRCNNLQDLVFFFSCCT